MLSDQLHAAHRFVGVEIIRFHELLLIKVITICPFCASAARDADQLRSIQPSKVDDIFIQIDPPSLLSFDLLKLKIPEAFIALPINDPIFVLHDDRDASGLYRRDRLQLIGTMSRFRTN